MSETIKSRIISLPRSSVQDVVILNHSALQISYYNVYTPESTIVVLFISNKTPSALSNLSIQLALAPSPLSSLTLNFDGDPKPSIKPGVIGFALQPYATSTQLILTSVRDISAVRVTGILGRVTLPSTPSPVLLNFNAPFLLSDLLRPAVLTTQGFGAQWGIFPAELKFSLRSSRIASGVDFMNLIKTSLHLHPVQTIGLENIAAGALAVTGQTQAWLCLVHVKVTPVAGGSEINGIVRTKSGDFTAALTSLLQQSLV